MKQETLAPIFSKQKSFYDKSFVIKKRDPPKLSLYSYKKLILSINHTNQIIEINQTFEMSKTSLKHLNEFLKQYGFSKCTFKLWQSIQTVSQNQALVTLNDALSQINKKNS